MIKHNLYENTTEQFIVFQTKKQQPVFFPKEESQMFQSRDFDFISGDENNMSINQNAEAFAQRATGSYLQLNSSHTPTDYIGATNVSVPFTIRDEFAEFKVFDLSKNILSNLYEEDDTVQKVRAIMNGLQTIRIPVNIFNSFLSLETQEEEIIANGNSALVKNYGLYYIMIKPKYIETIINSIDRRAHFNWEDLPDNNDTLDEPMQKRRTIIKTDKEDFTDTPWNFENDEKQAGRLFGSVVEIWDASKTTLKQVKVIMENDCDFDIGTEMSLVLSPDNVGYDASSQAPGIGDVLRIFPRESYFNDIIIEVDYKDKNLQIENMISFLLNDVARDMQTGVYEVYDENGFKIETNGLITGNVIHRYQISATDRHELRKKIKQ